MTAERRKEKNKKWKGGLRLFLVFVMILGCQSFVRVQAAEPGMAQKKATAGTLGENGGITWSYDAGTKTLTVSGEDELHGRYDSSNYRSYSPFDTICAENEVERIVLQDCKLKGNAEYLFSGGRSLKSLDVSGLDTGNVTNMRGMFYRCEGLTSLDVSGFNTRNVTDMSRMFYACGGLTSLNVSGFNTRNVTDMSYMFYDCKGLTSLDVSGFNTRNVTDMSGMFYGCGGLTSLDVSGFNTCNVTKMGYMFHFCKGLTSLDVSKFDTRNVTDMSRMFYACGGLTSLDVSGFATGKVTDMHDMFEFCNGLTSLDVSGFATGNVTNMSRMFYECRGLTSLDVSKFDTGNVTDMSRMFYCCSGLMSLDVSGFNTCNVTKMGYMFHFCKGLTSLDVSKFDTGNVTDMSSMFCSCSDLTSLDVSGFNTRNVTNMSSMFSNCSGLTSLDVSKFDTRNVKSMRDMFCGCSGLTSLDVSGFDTGNVTDMECMFYGCRGLTSLDVSGFDTGNVTDMECMFYGCRGLTSLNISGFAIGSGTTTQYMFSGCTPSVLKAPKTVKQEISLDVSYRDTEGNVYTALTAENVGKELKRTDLLFYEILFNGNGSTGGSTAKLRNCEVGKSYTLPANAFIRTGYTFTGWNTKKDGSGTAYKDKAIVKDLTTKDGAVVTLYAQWKGNRYSIAFNGNGATGGEMKTLANRQVGTSYTLPANAFIRTGYTFTGWNTKKDGSGTAYKDKAIVKDLTTKDGAVVTLYAQWKGNRYSIAFNGNGATEGEMKTLASRQVGTSYTLPANKFKRTGYTFAGWNTKKRGSGTAYENKASVKDLTLESGATVTLYAQWKKSSATYQIKFNGNGGTGKMSALKCKTGKSYKLPANTFKKQGYTFAGWNTKKNGTGKSFKNKASVKDLKKKNGAVVTLYAQWKPNTYTVKFDGNKATSGKMKDLGNCQYGKSFKLTKSAYKRKGYTFAGWNTKKNGTGKSYKNGAQVKNLTAKNKGTVVLYAQWIKKK